MAPEVAPALLLPSPVPSEPLDVTEVVGVKSLESSGLGRSQAFVRHQPVSPKSFAVGPQLVCGWLHWVSSFSVTVFALGQRPETTVGVLIGVLLL